MSEEDTMNNTAEVAARLAAIRTWCAHVADGTAQPQVALEAINGLAGKALEFTDAA